MIISFYFICIIFFHVSRSCNTFWIKLALENEIKKLKKNNVNKTNKEPQQQKCYIQKNIYYYFYKITSTMTR
jgi:hypothetical protein